MDTTGITRFEYPVTGQPFRSITIDGEPWFILKDVCKILGLANSARTAAVLKEKHKRIHRMYTLGGQQDTIIVSEPGLYKVLMRSDKPLAEPFQDWIAEEVLPSIRKSGGYFVPSTDPLQHQLMMLRALEAQLVEMVEIKERIDAVESSVSDQDQRLQDIEAVFPVDPKMSPLAAFVSSRSIRLGRNVNWSVLGKSVTAFSKSHGYHITQVPHLSGNGTVNSYEIRALEEYFISMGKLLPAPVVIESDEEDED